MIVGTARLCGWLRISSADLCIGVSVFSAPQANHFLVAETDHDLSICDFLRIDDEEGFRISSDLPTAFSNQLYRVGEAVPIPVCVHGRCEIIHADDETDLPQLPRASREEVTLLDDLRELLKNARSGFYRDRFESHRTDAFAEEFEDILNGEAVHSRHWVNRIAAAVKALGGMPATAQGGYLKSLSEKCREWLIRFKGKADPTLLFRMIQLAERSLFSEPEFVAILIDLVVGLAPGDIDLLASDDFAQFILKRSPSGLFGLEQIHGDNREWPFRGKFNTLSWFNTLFDKWSKEYQFENLWHLSVVAFGHKDPPAGDIDRYRMLYRFECSTLEQRIRDDLKTFFVERKNADKWADHAMHLLWQENELRYLKRIFDGTQRSPSTPQDEVDGLWVKYVDDLMMYIEGRVWLPGFDNGATPRAKREAAAGRLSPRIAEWIGLYGPISLASAQDLLEASLGKAQGKYYGKLRKGRLEIGTSLGTVLTVKGREKIKSFRQVVKALGDELQNC